MTQVFYDGRVNLYHDDCLVVLSQMDDDCVDSVVTDPPYGLEFMGRKWDAKLGVAFRPLFWAEVLRVLKPGGHVVAFGGSRTYHRLACAIEDAGFEIRDQIQWIYGSGFPKSLNICKAINKTDNDFAKQWEGWGTSLKPSHEPIVLARKPLIGTNVENVLAHGTGALNIDGCRVEGTESTKRPTGSVSLGASGGWANPNTRNVIGGSDAGRWPANIVHDGSDEVVSAFPQSSVTGQRSKGSVNRFEMGDRMPGSDRTNRKETEYTDSGSAARFFYHAKASAKDRCGSKHPTVKPISLMRWLVRLVTPSGGVVLDPFAGSGTTAVAAVEEGFQAILIEKEDEYAADIARRLTPAASEAAE